MPTVPNTAAASRRPIAHPIRIIWHAIPTAARAQITREMAMSTLPCIFIEETDIQAVDESTGAHPSVPTVVLAGDLPDNVAGSDMSPYAGPVVAVDLDNRPTPSDSGIGGILYWPAEGHHTPSVLLRHLSDLPCLLTGWSVGRYARPAAPTAGDIPKLLHDLMNRAGALNANSQTALQYLTRLADVVRATTERDQSLLAEDTQRISPILDDIPELSDDMRTDINEFLHACDQVRNESMNLFLGAR